MARRPAKKAAAKKAGRRIAGGRGVAFTPAKGRNIKFTAAKAGKRGRVSKATKPNS